MAAACTDLELPAGTPIRATHVAELRAAGAAARAVAGLTAWPSSGEPVAPGTPIWVRHLTELREAIAELWVAAGLGPLPDWGAGLAATRSIRRQDVLDLRSWLEAGVRRVEANKARG